MILAGDVGGTKVNLATYELADGKLQARAMTSYPSRDFSNLEGALLKFLTEYPGPVTAAAFGIAGPVKRNAALLTNLRWQVAGSSVAKLLGVAQVGLMNDLVANAYGIAVLSAADFAVLNRGEVGAEGNQAVISAGTGLGEAGLAWDGTRHLPVASEGGNTEFSPRTDLDVELFHYLRAKFGPVIWEYLLSGPGQVNIYEFLRDTKRGEEPAWLAEELNQPGAVPAAIITRHALAKRSPLCEQAVELFVTYYGAESANLALKYLATGGVFLGGGIAPKIFERLKDGTFMKAFCASRYHDLLSGMPVKVILNDKTALLGAARFAVMQAGLSA